MPKGGAVSVIVLSSEHLFDMLDACSVGSICRVVRVLRFALK